MSQDLKDNTSQEFQLYYKEQNEKFKRLTKEEQDTLKQTFTDKVLPVIARYKRILKEKTGQDEQSVHKYFRKDERGLYLLKCRLQKGVLILEDLEKDSSEKGTVQTILEMATFLSEIFLRTTNIPKRYHDVWTSIQSYNLESSLVLCVELVDDEYPSFCSYTHLIVTNLTQPSCVFKLDPEDVKKHLFITNHGKGLQTTFETRRRKLPI